MRKQTAAARTINFYEVTKRGITRLEEALRRTQGRLDTIEHAAARERAELQARADAAEAGLHTYRQRLSDLLNAAQKEHARITGCPEDEYAIQLIRLCNQKIEELTALRSW